MPYKPPTRLDPLELRKFLGVNEAVGDIEQNWGDAVFMRNWRLTKNNKPQRRNGYTTFIDYGNTKPVNALWRGRINSKNVIITTNDAKVFEYDRDLDTNLQIGTITDLPTEIYWFESKIYFINGIDWKVYDGTTYGDVDPYVPTIEIGGAPDGTGAENFEELNIATNKRISKRFADGVDVNFVLPEEPLTVYDVKVNDVTVGYTWVSGTTVVLDSPHIDLDEVEIYWTFGSDSLESITKNRYNVTFGKDSAESVFLWGNEDRQNVFIYSISEKPTYFTANTFTSVGTNDCPITVLKPMQDIMIISKNRSTHKTFPELNPLYELNNGLNKYVYPNDHLNNDYGSVVHGISPLIGYTPVTFDENTIYRWTDVYAGIGSDPQDISQRIRLSLEDIDISTATVFNYKHKKEIWINVGDVVYIYNYDIDEFYMFNNIEAIRFTDIDNEVCFATSTGTVELFDDSFTDNGFEFEAELQLAFTAFEAEEMLKNTFAAWVTIDSASSTSVTVSYETDNINLSESDEYEVKFRLLDYGNIDYSEWSYETNRNSTTAPLRLKIKKYQYIKFIFTSDEPCTILNFKVRAEAIKEVR